MSNQMNVWRSDMWQEIPVKVIASMDTLFQNDEVLAIVLGYVCHALMDKTWIFYWKEQCYEFTDDGKVV